jgi:hypothetical protein
MLELLIRHLIYLVYFLLKVELIVLLANVSVILSDRFFDIGLAFVHYLNVLLLSPCHNVRLSKLLSYLFVSPCS